MYEKYTYVCMHTQVPIYTYVRMDTYVYTNAKSNNVQTAHMHVIENL